MPEINNGQYPRIPSKILKDSSHEEVVNDEDDEAMIEMNNDEAYQSDVDLERMECSDTQISCMAARSLARPLKACRPLKVSTQKSPSTQRYLAGPSGAHPLGRPSFPT
jgi:hypothetical protein